MHDPPLPAVRLGLRANWRQFALLVVLNGFVGSMVGVERAVLPVLGAEEFGVAAGVALLGFVASFGAAKALANLAAGRLGDTWGRRRTLLLGWALAPVVPLMVLWAPDWGWVVAANVVLGVSQGLAWSMTVVAKIDLAGPARRGLAMGLNEAAGYVALGASAWVAWELGLAYGMRQGPFLLNLVLALAGLGLALMVRETRGHAQHEARLGAPAQHAGPSQPLGLRAAFARATWRDRDLAACSQAGLVNNLNDGVVWGLLPALLLAQGGGAWVGLAAALYPATWGLAQLATGAWSDRIGRKPLIVGGMVLQAAALATYLVPGPLAWAGASALLGLGTAMVYPTLLGAVGDRAGPASRAGLLGVYRFWRDAGFVAGALGVGALAQAAGLAGAFQATALLTLASGAAAAVLLRETLPGARASRA